MNPAMIYRGRFDKRCCGHPDGKTNSVKPPIRRPVMVDMGHRKFGSKANKRCER